MVILHLSQNADIVVSAWQSMLAAIHHIWHLIPADIRILLAPPAKDEVFTNMTSLIQRISTFVRNIALIVFLISITIAAMMRMTAFGGQQRIMYSNMAMTSAIIGLIIVAIAQLLQSLITGYFDPTLK
jgi:hypothetical protein